MFKIDWVHIRNAIVYGVVSMAFAGVITIVEAILAHHSVFGLDWHHLIDLGAMAALGVFTTFASVIKDLLTTKRGDFVGLVSTVPDKRY